MRSKRTGWLLLSPTLIILGVMGMLPFFYVIYVGFFNWVVFAAEEVRFVFAGINNYRQVVFDPDFLGSLVRTLEFSLITVTAELVLGFLLANTLVKDFPLKGVFRTIHSLPLMVAPIAVGVIWRLLMIPGLGLLPYYFKDLFGIDWNIGKYGEQAFGTIVLMDIWHWTPFVTLVMLAGLSSMPREPVEQAQVDGASRWQIIRYLTIPMIMPLILTVVFIRLMDTLRIVDEVLMLTGGGPGVATRFAGVHLSIAVFAKTDYGYGSAMSLVVLYFTIVLCWALYTVLTQLRRQQQR
jgi:multiple sugar transport system permease protein